MIQKRQKWIQKKAVREKKLNKIHRVGGRRKKKKHIKIEMENEEKKQSLQGKRIVSTNGHV